MNKVILQGNVGKDAELQANDKIARFSLCTNRNYKDAQGNKVTESEWHDIKCFGTLKDVVMRYVRKGSQLLIEGRIHYSSYERKDGTKAYTTEIIADNIELLGGKPEPQQAPQQQAYQPAPQDDPKDDLPF